MVTASLIMEHMWQKAMYVSILSAYTQMYFHASSLRARILHDISSKQALYQLYVGKKEFVRLIFEVNIPRTFVIKNFRS